MYADRLEAGAALADALADRLRPGEDAVVLGLPRGGVVVAAAVARRCSLPLDVLVVRKLGVPGRAELAMGAIASGGVVVRNEGVLRAYGVDEDAFAGVVASEQAELRRREQAYRGDRPPVDLRGRTAVVVDDGLATGATVRAAIAALPARGPARVLVAVPVGSAETIEAVRASGVEVVCPLVPAHFLAVGQFYGDFRATGDDEVRAALAPVPPGPSVEGRG